MRRYALLFSSLLLTLAVLAIAANAMSNGAPDLQCTKCHVGASKADFVIEGLPTKYEPGKTYKITIRITKGPNCKGGAACGGFAFWASAGKIIVTDKKDTFITTMAGKTYITHTKAGSLLREWTFEWKAPDKPVPVTVIVSVIAANGDSSPVGDAFATKEFKLQPAGGGQKPTPTAATITTTITTSTTTTTVVTSSTVITSKDPTLAAIVAVIIFLIVVGGYLAVARR